MLFRRRLVILNVLCAVVLSGGVSGCSSPAPQKPEPPAAQKSVAASGETAAPVATPAGAASSVTVKPTPPAPKTPAGGPWFEDPLAEVKKSGISLAELTLPEAKPAVPPPVAPKEPKEAMKEEASSAMKKPESSEEPKKPAGLSFNIESEPLLDEMKRLRARLRENLQTTAKYNAQRKQVEMDALELGLLTVFVGTAPTDMAPTWKRHVPGLRYLSEQIAKAAEKTGSEGQQKGKQLFESLDQLFQGNIPDNLPPDLKGNVPVSEYIDRPVLMRRLEQIEQQMQGGVANAAGFKKQRDALLRDAVLEIVLILSISDREYDSVTEPKYQAAIKEMLEATIQQRDAIKQGDQKGAEGAFQRVRTGCNACHATYRTGGGN